MLVQSLKQQRYALNGPSDFFAERAAEFETQRDLVVAALNAIQGINCLSPEGAFYVFPSCEGLIGKRTLEGNILTDDIAVSAWLLTSHHVSTVPGSVFSLSPHIRISTAASQADLKTACTRITAACATLSGTS